MSLFPRGFQEFSPLFRLMDDYANVTRDIDRVAGTSTLRAFQPKFDVRELNDSYELHGELPGIDQKDVNVEWSDGNTLTISGRTEHRSERGQRADLAGAIEPADQGRQASVEDATEGDQAKEGKSAAVTTTADAKKEVGRPAENEPRYWVSERSVGEFHRSFSFPTRVDQEAVKASLRNGILSIVVPKAAPPTARKIDIE